MKLRTYIFRSKYFILFTHFHFFLFTFILTQSLQPQSMEEFSDRRRKLMSGLSPADIIVIASAEEIIRNGDVHYQYRQSSNLYYLTGCEEPGCVLILSPGKKLYDRETRASLPEILFIPSANPADEIWTGHRLTVEEAKQRLGFSQVKTIDMYESTLKQLVEFSPTIYLDSNNLSWGSQPPPLLRPLQGARENLYPLSFASIRERIGKLRETKSSSEIANIRKAIDITGKAIDNVMKKIKPGMYEYEIDALIGYMFRRLGSERMGFPAIVGSGPNSCILHYEKNNHCVKSEHLILMDIGAEWRMYTADITRTVPASGTFTPRQREIYSLVLAAQQKAMSIIRPGIVHREIHAKAVEVISEGLLRLGIIHETPEYKKYYMHGTSHFLGMDVHDISASDTLKCGMVLTVEPGIYIPEEEIGIRIEDDVLVTEYGFENLSSRIPSSIEDIESIMKERCNHTHE